MKESKFKLGDNKNYMKFESVYGDVTRVTTLSADSNLDEVYEEFNRFLKGCGYYPDESYDPVYTKGEDHPFREPENETVTQEKRLKALYDSYQASPLREETELLINPFPQLCEIEIRKKGQLTPGYDITSRIDGEDPVTCSCRADSVEKALISIIDGRF